MLIDDYNNEIKIKKENGEIYKGELVNGLKEGKGEYISSNGEKYIGEFKNDVKDGKGIMEYKNGDKYDGNFKNGLRLCLEIYLRCSFLLTN